MPTHPVTVDVVPATEFPRGQVLLRLVVVLILSGSSGAIWLSHGLGAFGWHLLWLGLPLHAAISVARDGEEGWLLEAAPRSKQVVSWVVGFIGWLLFVTDRLPGDARGPGVRLELSIAEAPSVTRALLRLAFTVPAGLVLGLGGVVAVVTWWYALVLLLLGRGLPTGVRDLHGGLLRWCARTLAYHASLVGSYPRLDGPVDVAART